MSLMIFAFFASARAVPGLVPGRSTLSRHPAAARSTMNELRIRGAGSGAGSGAHPRESRQRVRLKGRSAHAGNRLSGWRRGVLDGFRMATSRLRLVREWADAADCAAMECVDSIRVGAERAMRPGDGAGRVAISPAVRWESIRAGVGFGPTGPAEGETFPARRIIAFKEGHR